MQTGYIRAKPRSCNRSRDLRSDRDNYLLKEKMTAI